MYAVTMQVGDFVGRAPLDVGVQRVQLYSAGGKFIAETSTIANPDGSYSYFFDVDVSGSYYILASSDLDYDHVVCGLGEACGAYPNVLGMSVVTLPEDQAVGWVERKRNPSLLTIW